MATIKSYTDIEQSKKLAEILPLESADMWWLYITAQGKHIAMMYEEPDPHYLARMESYEIKNAAIHCWSLTALLNVLPVSCDDGQHCLALINHNPNEKTEWLCAYEDDKGNLMMECYANNQIDACYEMILKLKELNLLFYK